jgi:hypothetical protein
VIEGIPLVDAHVHAARLPTLPESWRDWAARYGSPSLHELYDEGGTIVPERFDEYMDGEGVDVAILFCERTWSRYSPTTPPASASWQTSTRTFTTPSSTS